ncbi:NADH dehydrogenase [Rubrobacter taiwanensis]|uniref:NADH dehydrogenase n=1 Tax=Rubrobacter taiwanensis TaxID=185139 RepID=A0A4R1BCG0_9ACTN|nr:complex I subunit 5 family protein [Rubrobacter taiwanensis]TCJ14694.1 NADH dehydrogenase [Rubrobacter taiwanensis]
MSQTYLTAAAWPAALALPLLLAFAILSPSLRRASLALAPLAALPALGLALLGEGGAELPWVLLGMSLGLDGTTRVFLLFTALLWTVAGIYARSYMAGDANRHRFFAFFLITMTGNLGLILARDIASFYLFFVLMSFSAYGLVIHDATSKARRAAQVYLVMTIIGEAFVLPAVLISASISATNELAGVSAAVAGSPARDTVIALALIGFGVKAGAIPLHLWLPLAHPAAPTPASAVLSGTMIKAGLLGWLHFLPAGEAGAPGWGTLVMLLGLAAVFFGVLAGATQSDPKTVLAYSSISQMGLMTLALGVGLATPDAWPLALTAILAYAAHHGLVKGALFLGVGVAQKAATPLSRRAVFAALVFAALVIAGAPLTSGASAKETLKEALYASVTLSPGLLEALIQLGAAGTTVLLIRFLQVLPRQEAGKSPPPGMWVPWAALMTGVAGAVLLLPEPVAATLSLSALWPVALGAAGAAAAVLLVRRGALRPPHIPEGDLLIPALSLLAALYGLWDGRVRPVWAGWRSWSAGQYQRILESSHRLDRATLLLEDKMRPWTIAGTIFVLLVSGLLALAALG